MTDESGGSLPGVVNDSLARRAALATPAQVRAASFEEIVQLRYDVLRAGLPREAATFEGDHFPSSRHYGAFFDDRNVGCATLHFNHWLDEPAWQLRGMATSPDFRGSGVGSQILQFVEADLRATHPVRLLWCNARVPAARFYRRLDWQIVSDVFEIPTAGPHYQMVKRL